MEMITDRLEYEEFCVRCGKIDPPKKYVCFGPNQGVTCVYCGGDVEYRFKGYAKEEVTLPASDSAWIETYTGIKMHPLNPNPKEISIIDIAHALSNICRYTGHVKEFYSVAQHSVLVSELVGQKTGEDELAFWGLMHDASEAYLQDIPKPLKDDNIFGPVYRKYESALMDVIAKKFGLPRDQPAVVDEADIIVLLNERKVLMPCVNDWFPRGLGFRFFPIDTFVGIDLLGPEDAEAAFMRRFNKLFTR